MSGSRPSVTGPDWGPSRWAFRAVVAVGALIAAYLTYVHVRGIAPICASGGCERVQSSSHAELFGVVPVAALGLAGYLAIMAASFLAETRRRPALAVLCGAGCAFSIYLQAVSKLLIGALCPWCLASACIMTVLAAWSALRWIRS